MITVVGNKPVMRRGDNEIGIVGDNLVKTLEFSIDRIQGAIDLNDYSAWALIERSAPNGGASYSTMVTKATVGDKITISLPITSNETKDYGYIYSSIKFAEDEESLPIWQTQRILLKIAKGINGETEAEALETNIFDAQVAAFQSALDAALELDYVLLDQTSPQSFTGGDVSGTGLLKVTAGELGIDETTYLDSSTTIWDLADNSASALSFNASGKDGMLKFITTNGSEKVSMSGGLVIGENLDIPTSTSTVGQIKINGNRYFHSYSPVVANSNLFVGYNSGNFTMSGTGSQASYNTAIGNSSLAANTTGTGNTAIGQVSLAANTSGSANSAMGSGALYYNTTGFGNSAMGSGALAVNITGSYNSAIGEDAGAYSVDGDGDLTQINNSVFIGSGTRAKNDTGDTNEIVIGYNAIGLGSNSVVLGNSDITTTALRGNVGIGTTTPNANAILDISSTTKAFMPPRATTTQIENVGSPAEGMVMWDITLHKLKVYDGSNWKSVLVD